MIRLNLFFSLNLKIIVLILKLRTNLAAKHLACIIGQVLNHSP